MLENFTVIHLISLVELLIISFMIFSTRISKKDILEIRTLFPKLKNTYIQTLKNTIYSNSPILERLIAFKEYIKQGGNGNCKNFAITNLILPNKELWQSVLNNDKLESFSDDKNHYYDVLDEIGKRVLDMPTVNKVLKEFK